MAGTRIFLWLLVAVGASLAAAPTVTLKNNTGSMLFVHLDVDDVPAKMTSDHSITYAILGKKPKTDQKLEVNHAYALVQHDKDGVENALVVNVKPYHTYFMTLYEGDKAKGTYRARGIKLESLSAPGTPDADSLIEFSALVPEESHKPQWSVAYKEDKGARSIVISK